MKKYIRTCVGICVLSLSIGPLLAGCGKGTTFADAEGNKVTVSQDGTKVTFEAKEGKGEVSYSDGKMTFTDDKGNVAQFNTSVSEEQLGVPFYPGSKEAPGSSSMTGEGKKAVTSVRESTDPVSKIIAFYEGKLGKAKRKVETAGQATATWEKDAKTITVSATTSDAKTIVTVIVAQE